MVPFDSAHQIGLTTLLKEVLTVDEGVRRYDFKCAILGTFLLTSAEPVEIQ